MYEDRIEGVRPAVKRIDIMDDYWRGRKLASKGWNVLRWSAGTGKCGDVSATVTSIGKVHVVGQHGMNSSTSNKHFTVHKKKLT